MWGDATSAVEDELSKDERLLWSGQPRKGIIFRSSEIFMIPLSLLWCGFAIFWESAVIGGGAPFFFTLWGIPFVLIGLYLVVGRFFVDVMTRNRTYYALTNQRIIIISGLINRSVSTMNLATLSEINLTIHGHRRGTITLGTPLQMSWWFDVAAWPGNRRYAPPRFEMIEDARNVYEQIRQAQQKAMKDR